MSETDKLYVGMDVHKDSVMVAVLPETAPEPTLVKRLPNDVGKLRRFFDRVARDGEVRACYEASGAGYVLERALTEWGHGCEVVAPSLIPKRPGERRKHDRRDATDLARLYRAGELVTIRIPTAEEERVRDLVRCRETFQREILKSRHYVLKFLARRGFVYREGANWTGKHFTWLRRLLSGDALEAEDRRRSLPSTCRCWTTSFSAARSWTVGSRSSRWSRPTGRRSDGCARSRGSGRTRRWCS